MAEWCCKYVASVGLTLGFQQRGHDKGIHMRTVEAPASVRAWRALRTLKALFSTAWTVGAARSRKGLWVQRPLRAEETHVVMLRDHQLEDELDERGKSERGCCSGRPEGIQHGRVRVLHVRSLHFRGLYWSTCPSSRTC